MNKFKTGVILLNIGTTSAPTVPAVRTYLKQFLSDPRVIDIHPIKRFIFVRLFTLLIRPISSAKAYLSVWMKEGSPLDYYSNKLRTALQMELGDNYLVANGMRYGKPSIESAYHDLVAAGVDKIIAVPLFPQHSSAATGSAVEELYRIQSKQWNIIPLSVCQDFYAEPGFIKAFAEKCQNLGNDPKPYLLFSFHGLPVRHLNKSEDNSDLFCDRQGPCPAITTRNRFCYRAQAYETANLIAESLELSDEEYGVAFQSRLGRSKWIEPYTDKVLEPLIKQGIRHLAIACPSFICDCLETIEEIGIRAREQWEELGGTSFVFIPCLNDDATWVKALGQIVKKPF